MEIYGILGFPLDHSLSPLLHNAAFTEGGFQAEYRRFAVPPENLAAFFRQAVKTAPIRGLSVTIPHKVACLEFLDEISFSARALGAVNTIKNTEGVLSGENFDWRGMERALAEKTTVQGKRALICGAGGTARAAAFALSQGGAAGIAALVRDPVRATSFSRTFSCPLLSPAELDSGDWDIVINTTPLGTSGSLENSSPLPAGFFRAGMVVFDAVYNPLRTRFVREAGQAGATVITGDRLFLHQAAAQFNWWTGTSAPIALFSSILREKLGPN